MFSVLISGLLTLIAGSQLKNSRNISMEKNEDNIKNKLQRNI